MTRALVFDSGVGGLSVLDAFLSSDRAWRLDYLADSAWLPYGEKADADLVARVPALIAAVAEEWAPEVVVIACNTASTIALDAVRARLDVPVVGVVPPIKPAAAASVSGVIGLLATPATIQRPYTDDLIARFAADRRVIRVGSTALVAQAEAKVRGKPVDLSTVRAAIAPLFAGPDGDRLDVVALACTHFPLLREELIAAAPRPVMWLDSGAAIARRAADVTHAPEGAPRVRRIGLTAPAGFRDLAPTLAERGFDAFAAVRDRAPFDVDVWRDQTPA